MNGLEIIIELPGVGFADPAYFFDNSVLLFLTSKAEGVAEDAEKAAREKEVGRQRHLLIVGLVFTLPLFLLSMARDIVHGGRYPSWPRLLD